MEDISSSILVTIDPEEFNSYLVHISNNLPLEEPYNTLTDHVSKIQQKLFEIRSLLKSTNPSASYRRVYDLTSYVLAQCRIIGRLQIQDIVERNQCQSYITKLIRALEKSRKALRNYFNELHTPTVNQSLASKGLYYQQFILANDNQLHTLYL